MANGKYERLARIEQKLDDFCSNMESSIKRIDDKLSLVKSTTFDNKAKISIVEQKHDDCTARKYFEEDMGRKDYKMIMISGLSSVFTGAIVYLITVWR